MHPSGKFLLLTSLIFLSIFLLRLCFDKRQAFLARKAWRLQHLTGARRKVGELFDPRPPTHHLK